MDLDVDDNSKRLSLTGQSSLSVVSLHTTALEICQSVYGEQPSTYDAIERFYEASASEYPYQSFNS